MTALRRHAVAALAAAAAALAAPAAATAAEAFVGVTTTGNLVTFQSDSPGMARSAVPIQGLQSGEAVLAIDVRPRTGALYALGSLSRIYVIDPVSGNARPIGSAPFAPALAGSSFGFDFTAAADRIRVTSDSGQNLRLNPDDGTATTDLPIAYAPGDPGAGTTPALGSVAYTPGTTARLYGIDSARDALVQVNPANSGRLLTVGPLGADLHEPLSFDIASDGRAFVAGRPTGAPPELFLADLTTGALSPASVFPTLSRAYGEIGPIAATGTVPDDTARPSVLVAVESRQARRRLRRGFDVRVSCSEACDLGVAVMLGREIAASGTGALTTTGATRVRVTPNGRGKRLARGTKARRLTLRVTALDAAGNARRVRRTLTFK